MTTMVEGRIVHLDDSRSVWVGIYENSFCFKFVNGKRKTHITLSAEATSAMLAIIADLAKDGGFTKSTWLDEQQ